MASLASLSITRHTFEQIAALRFSYNATSLPELSTGVSTNFEEAIEGGANWSRLGTAIFGSRQALSNKNSSLY
ncbi:hypothetical protein [Pajaroellobacter abortibovis]|uniref:Uncharacterized protein n=1 Tax=Pajaroellobacter abortibovis TaxID=1882918 RepID=A0A1L6MYV2_9BACT|nr:hypothetical protein [Pajaroellobacter abortibovis]APS00744.1 hypothetical protein BCY86_08685 [Pajaroellobacter abortibovis]